MSKWGRDGQGPEPIVPGQEATSEAVPAAGNRHGARTADGVPQPPCLEALVTNSLNNQWRAHHCRVDQTHHQGADREGLPAPPYGVATVDSFSRDRVDAALPID
jgi:hypothetical protein